MKKNNLKKIYLMLCLTILLSLINSIFIFTDIFIMKYPISQNMKNYFIDDEIAGWMIESTGISYDGAQYNSHLRIGGAGFSDETNGYLSRISPTQFYMEKFDTSYPYTTRQNTDISQNSIKLTNSSGDDFEIYVNGDGDLCANGGKEVIIIKNEKQ